MLLWVALALLTAATVAALTRPLMRDVTGLGHREADSAVYRHQLEEIEADRSRGLIDDSEASAARAEVARRLIQAAETGAAPSGSSPSPPVASHGLDRRLLLVCAGLIPLLAVGLYLAFGSPGSPSLPYASRVKDNPQKASVAELIAKVEERLRDHPEDGQGWDAIGPVYLVQQRYAEAADAFKKAIALLGETPKRLQGYAQAAISAANGIVKDDAKRALETLLARDADNLEARFWLAVAKEQDGKLLAAGEDLKSMLQAAPADAPWRPALEERLRDVADRLGPMAGAPFAAVLPKVKDDSGSGMPDAAAVAKLSPPERAAFIGRMVDGLSQRLKADGRDLAGWQQLVRAYVVLGRKTDAVAAIADARRNFAGDEKALGEIDAMVRSLGLGS